MAGAASPTDRTLLNLPAWADGTASATTATATSSLRIMRGSFRRKQKLAHMFESGRPDHPGPLHRLSHSQRLQVGDQVLHLGFGQLPLPGHPLGSVRPAQHLLEGARPAVVQVEHAVMNA